MQGRLSLLIAGTALAVGGGIAGAVVVAPALQSEPSPVVLRQAAVKQPQATRQHTFHVAKKARGMARGARQMADAAQLDANQALSAAGAANARLDLTQIVSSTAPGKVTTGSIDQYVSLGGPEVTATVPESGYIEVTVAATIGDEDDPSVAADGVVALFEDGQRVATDQDAACTGTPELDDGLISAQDPGPGNEFTLSTPPVPTFVGCGAVGNAATPLLLKRPPGTHTYELRYGDCDCASEEAAFQNRTLTVAPRL